MERSRAWIVLLGSALATALPGTMASAVIFPEERGSWPADWPKELEPLRATSRTLGVATGLQESIYEIPISDQQTFESIWPVVRRLATPGATLTLYRKGAASPREWSHHLSNAQSAIRIYAPSGGYSSKAGVAASDLAEIKNNIVEGKVLLAGPPWPESIVGKKGELPEYVVSETGPNGRLTWVAADWRENAGKPRGFYYRARVDIDLVVDGSVIDLNRVELPEGARVVDRRFGEE